MSVDVTSEVEIARPRADVAAFATDPDNALRWYDNIESVAWETPPPRFLGRPLSYTYEVREHVPGVAAQLMARAVRRANRKDLDNLKELLET